MSYQNLIEFAKQKIGEYPSHREEIIELVSLAQAEIESGEPEENECELAIEDINQITTGPR